MPAPTVESTEAAARALALLAAADACIDRRKLQRLDELDAYGGVGVSRERFLELAVACCDEIGQSVVGQSWLPSARIGRINEILDAVDDVQARLRICELAAAAIEADGIINDAERLLFDHALGRWRVPAPTVHGAASVAALAA